MEEASHTGVGLAQLQDTETFSNIAKFDNDDSGSILEHMIQLTRLGSNKRRQRYELAYVDSPGTGRLLEG
ncbi:hypothetical protein QBC42DRAFT_289608 [Cladorrhinum samala]|uniref:Uncharacterized protein n=1 Tax=Cladorrhinum samala TaxID=585594 RepID=A0AAV9HFX0_9PEZI|nr:hypothetical protein QBC42DRAFT_289608 [Cladorrhinum samala]